jgi:multimeric flavodoxin WrbA
MKTLLGIVGSPRKNGNTHLLVSRILEGAQEEGVAGDLLLLGELTIRQCDGCHVCWQGKPCSKNDDMSEIYARIAASDAMVFGTPVYWYGPTALMKGFIDRFAYFNCPQHRPQVRGKRAVVAVPFEEETPETARLLLAFFEKCFEYLEMRLIGHIAVPGVSEKGDVLAKQDSLAEAHALGAKLARILHGR